MDVFGLIGYPLKNTYSADYFNGRFREEDRDAEYRNFPLADADEIREFLLKPHLKGFNVTIPYKEKIIPYLDHLSPEAAACGAVNCVMIGSDRTLTGYNTDVTGFRKSLQQIKGWDRHEKALILGNGGASKAVEYVLNQLHIPFLQVARNPKPESPQIHFSELDPALVQTHTLIIQTTPLGMFPNSDDCPDIPYDGIGKDHLCYDLIYLPDETLFLNRAKEKGSKISNGLQMLKIQAEEAYKIWMV